MKIGGGTDTLMPSTMRLTEAWRNSIKASAVPLDTRALAIIQRAKAGPLALDLYYWLAHRLYTVRRPIVVPWALLARQFGPQYDRLRDFRAAVVRQLRVIALDCAHRDRPRAPGVRPISQVAPARARRGGAAARAGALVGSIVTFVLRFGNVQFAASALKRGITEAQIRHVIDNAMVVTEIEDKDGSEQTLYLGAGDASTTMLEVITVSVAPMAGPGPGVEVAIHAMKMRPKWNYLLEALL